MVPGAPSGLDDPRSIRLAHIRPESDIKSVGQLCYLVTVLSVLGTVVCFLVATGVLPYDPALNRFATPSTIRGLYGVLTAFLLLHTIAQWALGLGLTRLQSWARWTVVGLTGLSLVSHVGFSVTLCFTYPIWGLLSLLIGGGLLASILYPLLTTGAGVVFSRPYKEVIRATPEIRSRMHWLLKLCIALILAGVVGFVGFLAAIYRGWV